ncbi:MAG TPA: hypothetical protein VF316_25695 [Polyangiaceae bacterium]
MKSRLAFLGLALFLAAACTTQSEGQRCQFANGNDDCDNGLACVEGKLITLPGGGNSNADICCPVDRTQAVEDICKLSPVTPGSDASIPDTGTPDSAADTGAKDGASDASDAASDAGSDGASSDAGDASSDAADDGG